MTFCKVCAILIRVFIKIQKNKQRIKMSETLKSANNGNIYQEDSEAQKSPEASLEGIESAAQSSEAILVEAINQSGASIAYTEGGIKGFAETGIPGGHISAEFNSLDGDPILSGINIDFQGQAIRVNLDKGNGEAEIYLNGSRVTADSLPAMQGFLDVITKNLEDRLKDPSESTTESKPDENNTKHEVEAVQSETENPELNDEPAPEQKTDSEKSPSEIEQANQEVALAYQIEDVSNPGDVVSLDSRHRNSPPTPGEIKRQQEASLRRAA